jgi:hypothetical protein
LTPHPSGAILKSFAGVIILDDPQAVQLSVAEPYLIEQDWAG